MKNRRFGASIGHFLGATSVLALLAAIGIPNSAHAQTTSADTGPVENVIVTGSRRTDLTVLTSPTPIQVVDNATLSNASITNLSGALQYQIPSFEFPQNNASASVQYAPKAVSLHGLGPDQTLVLVNGIRYHMNSQINTTVGAFGLGAQVVDIDTIPVTAVGHVEVLLDGASAQYGSDALAGVVNIILKKQDSGADLTAQYSQYVYGGGGPTDSLGGGATTTVSGSFGFSLPNNGFVHLAVEGVHSTPEQSPAAPDTRQFYFPTSARAIFEPSANDPRRYWFYGAGTYNKLGLMANGEMPITENLTAYGLVEAGYRQNYGFGNFRRPEDNGTVRAIFPDGFQPLQLVMSTDYDASFGLKYDAGDIGKFNLSAEHGSNRAAIRISNTDNASLGTASPTSGRSGATQDDETNLNLDYTKELSTGFLAGPLTVAAGGAYRHQRYTITAGDPFSYINGGQPILDGTSAGTPAALGSQSATGFQPADAGSFGRDVVGVYLDLEAEVIPHLNMGISGRSDNYSDFGWTNNGKISARYEFSPAFAIRGAASTGFRAPSIAQVDYSRTTGIFVNNVQYLQRIVQPGSAAGAALGAKPLQPENSTSYTGGFVLTGWGDSAFTVDAYDIHVGHRITLSQSLTGTVVSGLLANAGFPSLQGAQFFTNGVNTHTQGVDITAHKTLQFDESSLTMSAAFNVNSTVITYVAPNPPQLPASIIVINRQTQGFITSGEPDNKLVAGLDYNWGDWTFSPKATRYGNYKYLDLSNAALDQTYSSQWVADLSVAYKITPSMTLTAGAHNLFNSYPDKQIAAERSPNVSQYTELSPDGAFGIQPFLRLSASL